MDRAARCEEALFDGEKSVVETLSTLKLENSVVGGEAGVSPKAAAMHIPRKDSAITGRREKRTRGAQCGKAVKSERTLTCDDADVSEKADRELTK